MRQLKQFLESRNTMWWCAPCECKTLQCWREACGCTGNSGRNTSSNTSGKTTKRGRKKKTEEVVTVEEPTTEEEATTEEETTIEENTEEVPETLSLDELNK